MQKGISSLVGILIIIVIAIVAFGGVFAYQYFTAKPQPVVQPKTTNQQTNNVQPTDQTAGWKTYTNTQYGYEIKYPSSWYLKPLSKYNCGNNCLVLENINIENIKESVNVTGNDGTSITENGSSLNMTILSLQNLESIKKWISTADLPDKVKQERLSQIKIMDIAGIEREVWTNSTGSGTGIEFVANGKLYKLAYMSGSIGQFNKDLPIFNQILSTFKFTK